MDIVWAVVLVVGSLVSWLLNVIGVPGNWLMVLFAALYVALGPSEGVVDLSWQLAATLGGLAFLGEVIEFLASAVGTKRAGGSKRGTALAMAGSLVGGLLGLFIGIPIPVIGPIVSAILFASAGAMAGAVVGERWKGRDMPQSMKVGEAAFWSRALGTLAKMAVGLVMLVVLIAGLLL